MKTIFVTIFLSFILAGCVGSPIHSSLTYDSVQKKIKTNNNNLLSIKAGISKDEVMKIMGKPSKSEGYPWGIVWFYRTAMTSGIYGEADSDYTPMIFNQDDILQGYGRNYYQQYSQKYEIEISNK